MANADYDYRTKSRIESVKQSLHKIPIPRKVVAAVELGVNRRMKVSVST